MKTTSASKIDKRLAAMIVAFLGVAAAYATSTSYVSLHYDGKVKGIGVGIYQNEGCTQQLKSINVGLVDPGTVENTTVYIRNEGNAPASLSLAVSNWEPGNASNFISLTWDYDGRVVDVNNVVQVVLLLSVSSQSTMQTFSFDLVVSASG